MPFVEKPKYPTLEVQNPGWFTRQMLPIFGQLSQAPLPTVVHDVNPMFLRMVQYVYTWETWEGASVVQAPTVHSNNTPIVPRPFPQADGNRRVVLGYSGGKDSLAAALTIQSRGMTPVLFHVKGLNRSYPREFAAVQEVANATGWELVVQEVRLHGEHAWPDNPVKDQMILAMMLDYGVPLGISRYTMGVEKENVGEKSNIRTNWSDQYEMFYLFREAVRQVQPEFSWNWVLDDHSQSYAIITQHRAATLLDMTTSCVTPHRFQDLRKRQNEQKYGIRLPPHRCGSCWKCCVDYLCRWAYGLRDSTEGDPSVEFGRHCLDVFHRQWVGAYGPAYKTARTRADVLRAAVDPRWVDVTVLEEQLL